MWHHDYFKNDDVKMTKNNLISNTKNGWFFLIWHQCEKGGGRITEFECFASNHQFLGSYQTVNIIIDRPTLI